MTVMDLELPQLTGGARRAVSLIQQADLPTDLAQYTVTLDCKNLLAGTDSFADELLRILIVERNVGHIEAEFVEPEFAAALERAAEKYDFARRLNVHPSVS